MGEEKERVLYLNHPDLRREQGTIWLPSVLVMVPLIKKPFFL
jgi:hypothetical protein